eukprot:GAHX01002136.1.p1 GENE.GAHX01002136.1~~GAHX01002136.1.p1  ORF type:complete len:1126 (+),score=244.94 GAHX01002136.1:38-3415(+)
MTETRSSSSNKVYEKDGFVIQRKHINQILANNIGGKKYFLQIMLVLKRYDITKVFYYDIDSRCAPNYYEIIKEPMNFAIIRKNIQDDKYSTLDSFFKDVVLMFENARLYNDADTPYFKFADEMEQYSLFLKNIIHEGVQRKISAQKSTLPKRTSSVKEETGYQAIERKILELDAISKNTPFEFPLHKYTKRAKLDPSANQTASPSTVKEATTPNNKKEALKDDLADDKLYSDLEWAVMLNKTRSTKTYKCGKDCACLGTNVDECVCVQFGLNCKSGCLCYLACNNTTNYYRSKNTFDFNHDEKTPSKVLNVDLINLVGIDELGRSTFTKILFEKIKQTDIINQYKNTDEIKVHILTLLNYCIKEINEKITEIYKVRKVHIDTSLSSNNPSHLTPTTPQLSLNGLNNVNVINGISNVESINNISDGNTTGGSGPSNSFTAQKSGVIERLSYSNINFKDHLFEYNMAQSKLNLSEELKQFILSSSKDDEFNSFVKLFYEGISSVEKLNHAIYQIHLYNKGFSAVNLINTYKKGEVVTLLGGEVLSPFHFVERQNTMTAMHKYLQFMTHPFYSFCLERHWDDPTGYDSMYCTIPTLHKLSELATTGNDSKIVLQLLNHSCDPNLSINSFLINRQYYPALAAIKDIEPGAELTLDYRAIVGFYGGNKKRVCLCSNLNCLCMLSDYMNYSTKNMENLLKSNSTSEVSLLLSNASTLYKSIKQIQQNENSNNDEAKLYLNSLGIKDCILDLAPLWLQMFMFNTLKSTEDMTPEQLKREQSFININRNQFPYSSLRQSHILTKSELIVSKVQKLSMLADFVKHFVVRKAHLNDKAPLSTLTDKEMLNKLFLSEDSLINEARKFIKAALNDHNSTTEEQLVKINPELTKAKFEEFMALLKSVSRTLSVKPTTFIGNGQEEANGMLEKIVTKVKEYTKEHRKKTFDMYCHEIANVKLLLQIMYLWFNTDHFFFLNKYSSIMQRYLEVEEIIAEEDLEEIEKHDDTARAEFNKHCNTDRKYSPYYPWLCCLYWEFPFLKKANTSLNQQKVFSYTLPGIDNCKRLKELNMVKELRGLHLNLFYQNNNFEFKYKTKSIYGTPWLDYYITGDKEKYEKVIGDMETMLDVDDIDEKERE